VREVSRRNVLLAVLAVALVGGVAVGILVTRGGTESALAQGRPGVLARGPFKSLAWGTTGSAQIVRDSSGHLKLRFSRAFTTQPAPELFVYLARYQGSRRIQWTEVGSLHSASGAQEYALSPSAVKNLHISVAVYCGKCNKVSGAAQLQPAS
jgi:ribose/xylose/arabinose/galactoside ABC-type transport system permease subunit